MTQTTNSFYRNSSASNTIMTLANIPDEVLPLLQMETLETYQAMTYLRCTALVEMGCYDGRALEIARTLGARYLGVDLAPEAIGALRARIHREDYGNRANAFIDDIQNHSNWDVALRGANPLYLLPFNLLGTVAEPRAMISSLSASTGAAVIAVFGEGPAATTTRHAYYSRCGVRRLEHRSTDQGGVLFTGANDFYSQSFTKAGFRSLLTSSGVSVLRMTTNSLGHCATVALHQPSTS